MDIARNWKVVLLKLKIMVKTSDWEVILHRHTTIWYLCATSEHRADDNGGGHLPQTECYG